MGQEEKIVQITGSGDVVYALSSEAKLYVGTLNEKKGFEWRRLPEMNFENMKSISTVGTGDSESSQPVFAVPASGEIKTASIMREDPVPEMPKQEAPKSEAAAPKK